jgi:small-conductance mechanosensitive channel/CRP-like cAMP-binding protein
MQPESNAFPLSTVLALAGFPYAALAGVRALRPSIGGGPVYGGSLIAFAVLGFLAWLGVEVELPITIAGPAGSEPNVVDIPICRTLAELAAGSAVSAFLVRATDLWQRARGKDHLLQFQRIVLWLVGVVLSLVVIYQAHFAATLPIRTAVLSIGGASVFIVGLALQSALGNVFAGYGLQASRVFRKGDHVQLGLPGSGSAVVGNILDSTLATTRIITRDGQVLVVPNGALLSKDFMNLDQPTPRLREKVRVGISYEVPPARVKDAAHGILSTEPNVLGDPAPNVWLVDYGDSSIVYELVFWIPGYQVRDETLDRVRTRLWYALKDCGIEIPFPIRTVRMAGMDEERARGEREQRAAADAHDALARCPLFAAGSIQDAERREVARAAVPVRVEAGQHVVRRGEQSDSMFVVTEGACEVVLPSGQRIEIGPGGHFGEIALVTGERRTADVVAVRGAASLLRLPRSSVEPILARHREFGTKVSAVAHERRAAALGDQPVRGMVRSATGFARSLLRMVRPF